MFDWIMKRFGASIEELAQEQYEELLGYEGNHDEIDVGQRHKFKPGQGGHKPPRHDIQKLQELNDLFKSTGMGMHTGPPDNPLAAEQWNDLTMLRKEEKAVDLVYRLVAHELEDPATTGWFKGDEDPFQVTLDVLTGKHPHWHDLMDLALRNNMSAGLTADSSPLYSEEEARKLLSAAQRKQQVGQAPKIYNAIRLGLSRLRSQHPESYKLWPWYVKQVKNMYAKTDEPQSAYAHLVDIVGNAGKVLAEQRRQNRLPQNFDINKMDFDDLEKWYMDWKNENRASESQGEVVYQWDDGWTMQRLTDEAQLQYEGDEMGHCVGDYGHHVETGSSIIYSLRDPKGNPHVTMEMEGPELLTKAHDKPMGEWDENDVKELELGKQMRTKDNILPSPLFESGQDYDAYMNYTGVGKENRWPNYLANRVRVTPHSADENQQYYNSHGIPWNNTFYVVQVQGNSNKTPKPEYQKRVTEFINYLKSKGFQFQRSEDWYPNHDADGGDLLGYDNYSEYAQRYRDYVGDDVDNTVQGWYEHYRENPGLYGGENNEDIYGIQQGQKFSGYAVEEALEQAIDGILEHGEDPVQEAQVILHYAMVENFRYADIDQAVRRAADQLQDKANQEHETNWMTDNGTWMYTDPESGEDYEVEDHTNMPEESYFRTHEDPKYAEGYRFINVLDQYLDWYYDNKKDADRDKHPSMTLPKLNEDGRGFRPGTDPYAPSEEQQAKADQQAQQDAGPGFSSTDLNGVFSKTAETEHDPDYAFVYYMSELRTEEWSHNTSFETIFENLLNEFNVDLGNTLMDIDPQDVAAGEIRIRKQKPEIEHRQLCPPEIREQAEEAIGQWWANQWFEGLEHDWYEVDEDHTLTGDA